MTEISIRMVWKNVEEWSRNFSAFLLKSFDKFDNDLPWLPSNKSLWAHNSSSQLKKRSQFKVLTEHINSAWIHTHSHVHRSKYIGMTVTHLELHAVFEFAMLRGIYTAYIKYKGKSLWKRRVHYFLRALIWLKW